MKEIYRDSLACRFAGAFCGAVKACVKHSFIGRVTEIDQKSSAAPHDSRTVKYLFNKCNGLKETAIRFMGNSLTNKLLEDIKKELSFSPARASGVILVAMVMFNISFSLVFQRQIAPWGWLIRGSLLFAGLVGLFSSANWQTVKDSSAFLRMMRTIKNA